jgi:hypothetical protein
MVENMEKELVPGIKNELGQAEHITDTEGNNELFTKVEILAREGAELANEVMHSENASEQTKKKAGLLAKIGSIFGGKSPEEKKSIALAEIESHPQLRANYEEAQDLGRGELFVEAYQKLGTPFFWNPEEKRYQGTKFTSQ